MESCATYLSPLGEIYLTAEGNALTGLWFAGQKHFPAHLPERGETPVLEQAKRWLDACFSGKDPGFLPPLAPSGTEFQRQVWEILLTIPYGQTATYGDIAAALAKKRGVPKLSPRAVGNAVGRNKISLMIPCHRVLGAGNRLTGYAGGLERKRFLLELEGAQI